MPRSNTTPTEFKRMVLAAKEYIAAGDIFQVVLSQRFEAPFALPPFALYRALRRVNPSPYLFFLYFGQFAIAGSSPEILQVTASVTWPQMLGAQPVQSTTDLAPPVGAFSPTSGAIASQVNNAAGNPVLNVFVAITGPTSASITSDGVTGSSSP